MDFEPRHKQHWSQATEPQSLKDQWGVLESYIYVISKEFKPFDDEQSLHLVKLGMSKFESFDNSYKGLSRLAGLKTSLISFKVHRLYLYDSFDTNTKSTRAFKAEQQLHSAIEEYYKPDRVRVKFRGHASIKDLDPKTEWFVIPKKQMPDFLKWLDDQAFYEISPVAIYGTAFTARASNPIEIDKEKSAAAELELDVVAGRTRAKKGVLTQLQSKYAKSERQTKAEVAATERRKNELEEHAKLRASLRKTPEFFQRELVKQRFNDPDLDGEKWQDKVITDVDYFETPEGKKYRNMRVLYEPAPRKRGEKELKQKDLDKYGGVLTIPEALHYFPKLKKKFEDIYDWYVAAERLDAERVGQELAGSGYPVVRIGKYKNHQSRTKIGQRARFAVKPQKPGWIVQNVTLWWVLDNEKESITYAEAWRVISNRKINQQGDDDFMVPRSWIANHTGSLNVIAHAWWQAKLGEDFAQGDGEELWGRLYGADEHQTPAGPVLERFWIARWQKGETPMFDSQERNLVD